MPADVVLDVSGWTVTQREAEGSTDNKWLEDPELQMCLWKPNRIHKRHRDEQGEDWAELLAFRLARHLAVPAAAVHMARRTDEEGTRNGSISYDLISAAQREVGGWEMHNGSVLLQNNPGYWVQFWDSTKSRPKNRVGHTLTAVNSCLADVGPPPSSPEGFDAQATFAGYLLLDALIANQDRHDANWGVIVDPDSRVTLAPSYDHGASLGFSLTDERRAEMLEGKGLLLQYARLGRASKFEGRHQVLVDLAHEALAASGQEVRQAWLGRLSDLTPEEIRAHVQAVPRMSEVARTFCYELLVINRRRLLDVPD